MKKKQKYVIVRTYSAGKEKEMPRKQKTHVCIQLIWYVNTNKYTWNLRWFQCFDETIYHCGKAFNNRKQAIADYTEYCQQNNYFFRKNEPF
jgi:hypothetical protein